MAKLTQKLHISHSDVICSLRYWERELDLEWGKHKTQFPLNPKRKYELLE